MHHDPQFYRIRNHLVDFLVNRSKQIQADGAAKNETLIVSPGLAGQEAAPADTPAVRSEAEKPTLKAV